MGLEPMAMLATPTAASTAIAPTRPATRQRPRARPRPVDPRTRPAESSDGSAATSTLTPPVGPSRARHARRGEELAEDGLGHDPRPVHPRDRLGEAPIGGLAPEEDVVGDGGGVAVDGDAGRAERDPAHGAARPLV